MKSNLIIILLLNLCFLISCSSDTTVLIDNPTDKEIRVSFGEEKEVVIAAHAQEKASIMQGQRNVFLNGKEVGTITTDSRNEYLLNPTQSKYYIERVEYASEGLDQSTRDIFSKINENKDDELPIAIIMIDSLPYIGNIKVDSSLQIKDIWDYGVFEDLPESIQMQGYGVNSKIKVYREYAMAYKAKILNEQIERERKRKEKLEKESSE